MGKNRNFSDNLVTGLKAVGGGLVHYLIMFVIVMIFAFFAGGIQLLGPMAVLLLMIILIVTGIFVLGWIYNKFWGWN